METSIKEEILRMISSFSDFQSIEELKKCNAFELSQHLKMSRNLISHYLNQYFSEGRLIKINSRPVLYIDPRKLTEKAPSIQLKSLYTSIEELGEELKQKKKSRHSSVFKHLIGYQDSLKTCVEQCKSALSYPGNGLPFLLYGQTGTGKSFIAQLCYEYCKQKGLIAPRAEFVTVNCAEYANNPELFLINLFGYRKGAYTGADKDNAGLLSIANNGVLFLDEIHALTPECQEKIFLFMDKGIYHAVGDNETWLSSKVHLIFATTEDPTRSLLKTLLRRIPFIIDVPSLSDRFMDEKKELLLEIITIEAENIAKSIQLSEAALFTFLQYEYLGNVGEMKNAIQTSIAKANYRNTEESVQIHLFDLPDKMIKEITSNVNLIEYDDCKILDIHSYDLKNTDKSNLEQFNRSVLKLYDQDLDFDQFTLLFQAYMEHYNNTLLFNNQDFCHSKDAMITNLVKNIYAIAAEKYNLEIISNTQVMVISRFLSDYIRHFNSCQSILNEYDGVIHELIEIIKSRFPINYSAIFNISRLLQNGLNIQINELGLLDLLLYMIYCDSQSDTAQIPVIIVAHGYNIAGSIADFSNQLLKQKIFSAIDMPLNCSGEMIVSKVLQYIRHFEGCREFILMVDVGSLDEIYAHLDLLKDIDVGVINNVTTKLTLDIGAMVMNGYSIEMILEEASKRNRYQYSVIRKAQKQDAILCVCQKGFQTADKIKDLLEVSLPKGTPLVILTAEYDHSEEIKISSIFAGKYNILFTAGTTDPNISETDFISIEEIIENHNIKKMNSYLKPIMNENEITQFNQNIIRNFSLDNLIKYLTILNPEIIVNNVEGIIADIEEKLKLKIQSKTKVGLYIHISCLIERILINKSAITYDHLEEFIATQQDFIKIVQDSLHKIEGIYNVKIPLEEIGHLYDYIQSDSVKNKEDSVYDPNDLFQD